MNYSSLFTHSPPYLDDDGKGSVMIKRTVSHSSSKILLHSLKYHQFWFGGTSVLLYVKNF